MNLNDELVEDRNDNEPGFEVPSVEWEDPEKLEAWRIDHDNQATWALRKIWKEQQEAQRLKDNADREIAHVKRWLERKLRVPQREIEYFEGKLIEYHRRLRRAGKAGKTYSLPAGDIKARRPTPSVEVRDEDAFIEWCIAMGRTDLLKLGVAKAEVKKLHSKDGMLVTEDGEIVPGVQLDGPDDGPEDPDDDNYSVKVAQIDETKDVEDEGQASE